MIYDIWFSKTKHSKNDPQGFELQSPHPKCVNPFTQNSKHSKTLKDFKLQLHAYNLQIMVNIKYTTPLMFIPNIAYTNITCLNYLALQNNRLLLHKYTVA